MLEQSAESLAVTDFAERESYRVSDPRFLRYRQPDKQFAFTPFMRPLAMVVFELCLNDANGRHGKHVSSRRLRAAAWIVAFMFGVAFPTSDTAIRANEAGTWQPHRTRVFLVSLTEEDQEENDATQEPHYHESVHGQVSGSGHLQENTENLGSLVVGCQDVQASTSLATYYENPNEELLY